VQASFFVDAKCYISDVYVADNYAYVVEVDSGLRIIDVSTPAFPKEVGFFDTEGYAESVYISDNYAYVADWHAGLRIIDVSTPAFPKEVGFFDTADISRGVYVSGNYIYVADGDDGLYILQNELVTGIKENTQPPARFMLNPNYPNPFNSSTTISYLIHKDGLVQLKIYDISGRLVTTLVNEKQPAGTYRIIWQGQTQAAKPVSSGIYFCNLSILTKSAFSIQMQKIILIR